MFSWLVSGNAYMADTLLRENYSLFAPQYLIVELFKHKERILKRSKSEAEDLCDWLDVIIQKIAFVRNESVSNKSFYKAYTICAGVDPKDLTYLALAIELKSPLWTKYKPIITAIQQSGIIELFTPQPF